MYAIFTQAIHLIGMHTFLRALPAPQGKAPTQTALPPQGALLSGEEAKDRLRLVGHGGI